MRYSPRLFSLSISRYQLSDFLPQGKSEQSYPIAAIIYLQSCEFYYIKIKWSQFY